MIQNNTEEYQIDIESELYRDTEFSNMRDELMEMRERIDNNEEDIKFYKMVLNHILSLENTLEILKHALQTKYLNRIIKEEEYDRCISYLNTITPNKTFSFHA